MATSKTQPLPLPLRVTRSTVLGTAFLSLTFTFRPLHDPTFLPKTLVFWLGAAVVLVALTWHALSANRLPALPRHVAMALAAVPVALLLSLLVTDSVAGSMYGYPFHNAGVLSYLAGAVLAAAVVTIGRMDRRFAGHVVMAIVAGALANAAYGVIQITGLDPIRWVDKQGELIAFVANRNFSASVMAMAVGPLLVAAMDRTVVVNRRIAAAVTVLVVAVLALATQTLQGPLLVVAAPVVPVLALVATHPPEVRRRWLQVVAATAALAVVLVSLGIFQVGPLSAIGRDRNVVARTAFWQAGIAVAAESPLLGVGADRYGVHVREHRPASDAEATDASKAAIDPHSVPLAMVANAGIVGLLAHLLLVVVVGLALLRGLLGDLPPDRRRWLAAAGSIWLTYQVQSLVSLDIPPLLALHWLSAGAVLALVVPDADMKRRVPQVGPEVARRPVLLASGVSGVVALALVLSAAIQLDALATMRQANVLRDVGRPNPAIDAFLDVADSLPWWHEPWKEAGDVAMAQEDYDEAEEYFLAAEASSRGFVAPAVALVNLYAVTGRIEEARAASDRIFAIDSQIPLAWYGRARLELQAGNLDEAERFAREAVARGGLPAAWLELGRVLVEQGRLEEAQAAFEAGLEGERPRAAGPSLREELQDVRERRREERRAAAGG